MSQEISDVTETLAICDRIDEKEDITGLVRGVEVGRALRQVRGSVENVEDDRIAVHEDLVFVAIVDSVFVFHYVTTRQEANHDG